jgi:hypothetical protein
MATTLEKVRLKAARKLGLARFGQSIKSHHDTDLTEAYNELYDELADFELTKWSSTGSLPDKYADPVAALLAAARVDEYRVSDSRYLRVVNAAIAARRKLHALKAGKHHPNDNQTQVNNF